MSNATGVNNSNEYISWLEDSITKEYLNYYEYSEFKNIQPIAKGAFGNVHRANWKNIDTILVLKSFNNEKSTFKEVVNEV